MKRCPLSYNSIPDTESYSIEGLKSLDRGLKDLEPLQLTASELRYQATARAGKMSIQGVQPKLSAALSIRNGKFEIVDRNGRYILKPPSADYPELPENEDLTMKLAKVAGIEVPIHGLIRSIDGSYTYFIKRFDRVGRKEKVSLEDFAQLLGESRETKYRSSMEQVGSVIKTYCTFPRVEAVKLLRLTLFSFLIGNEDLHLKNFSLIVRERKIELSPAYDLLNSTIVITKPEEELALPLRGKKSKLKSEDLLEYFGIERLELNKRVITDVVSGMMDAVPEWKCFIDSSFLSDRYKKAYLDLLEERVKRITESQKATS